MMACVRLSGFHCWNYQSRIILHQHPVNRTGTVNVELAGRVEVLCGAHPINTVTTIALSRRSPTLLSESFHITNSSTLGAFRFKVIAI